MTFRRGFKSEANAIAKEIRAEMGLSLVEPLDPWALAAHLDIPVITLSSMAEFAPRAVHYFSSVSTGEFSAVTVFDGTKRIIVYNDSHVRGRQANDIAHEVSHGLLLHPPKPALDANGCRNLDDAREKEADWLASVLLIPEDAALSIARRNLPVDEAATLYGVSQQLVRWRLGATGARERVSRTREFYRRISGH
jgi:Zn-dependent peptidase ImmA (M78 family)